VLTTPFTYDNVNNLAVQIRFTNSTNSALGFYADNAAGTPRTQYVFNYTAATATANTSRMMMGFTGPPVPAPIHNINLTVENQSFKPKLKWKILGNSVEENFMAEIERSLNGQIWELLDSKLSDYQRVFIDNPAIESKLFIGLN